MSGQEKIPLIEIKTVRYDNGQINLSYATEALITIEGKRYHFIKEGSISQLKTELETNK